MALDAQQQGVLQKYVQAAKKIIYNPQRMKQFLQMMGTKEGALTAVQTVVAAIDKLRPVPSDLAPMLGVSIYMLMVDVAQAATDVKADPGVMKEVVDSIMSGVKTGAGGVVGRMQQGRMPDPEEPGDAPGPDNTAAHEGAESPQYEQGEGSEEDPPGEEDDGMLAKMRRGVPA